MTFHGPTLPLALALTLGLAACDGKDEGDDVPTDDTVDTDVGDSDDSDVVGPAATIVRVLAAPDFTPLLGAPILVHDADGNTVEEAVTDAAGEVEVVVPEGGAVSFLERFGGLRDVTTVFDVPAGGVVELTALQLTPTDDDRGREVAFQVRAVGSPASVTMWDVKTRCDAARSGSPLVDQSNERCSSVTVQDAVVVGYDAAEHPVAFGRVTGVPVEEDDVVVDVAMAAAPTRTIQLRAVGLPATAEQAYLNVGLDLGEVDPAGDSAVIGGFTGTFERTLELVGIDDALVTHSIEIVNGDGTIRRVGASRTPASSYTVDATDFAYPRPELVETDGTRPQVRWVVTPGDRGLGGIASVAWSIDEAHTGRWIARFDPEARTSVRHPVLPDDWADYRPEAELPKFVQGVSFTVEASYLDDFADWVGTADRPEAYETTWVSGGGN